jgi:hypothetical protein
MVNLLTKAEDYEEPYGEEFTTREAMDEGIVRV